MTLALLGNCVPLADELRVGDICHVQGQLAAPEDTAAAVFQVRRPESLAVLGAFTMLYRETPDRSAPRSKRVSDPGASARDAANRAADRDAFRDAATRSIASSNGWIDSSNGHANVGPAERLAAGGPPSAASGPGSGRAPESPPDVGQSARAAGDGSDVDSASA